MPHIDPRPREELAEFEEQFAAAEAQGGYVPNSLFLMGWRPEILRTTTAMFRAVMGPGEVDRGLKQMVAHVASVSAGCRYCQAHTATNAGHADVEAEKVAALFDFETSPLFTEAERAALRLGRDAAIVPNAVTREHFDALAEHYSEPQIVELMAAISMFGFLNRWNDSFATQLEDAPGVFASQHLHAAGWEVGKHERE